VTNELPDEMVAAAMDAVSVSGYDSALPYAEAVARRVLTAAGVPELLADRDESYRAAADAEEARDAAEATIAQLREGKWRAEANYLAIWDRLALAVDVIEAARGHRHSFGGGELDDAITAYDAAALATNPK